MTYETKQKADELCEKIKETKESIESLHIRIKNAERINEGKAEAYHKNRKTSFTMRLLNRSKDSAKADAKEEGSAKIIIFDNLGMYGTDLDVDEEIVGAIISTLENRLLRFEKEFAELG